MARPPLWLVEPDPVDELTPREREVLALMAQGLSNTAICGALFISPKTLERHVQNVFLKLGLPPSPQDHRRVRAVLLWLRSPLSGQPLTASANP
jgi:DNA-binding NarL/FixJ family response regulator